MGKTSSEVLYSISKENREEQKNSNFLTWLIMFIIIQLTEEKT